MADLIAQLNEDFARMDDSERRAYSMGMCRVYADVFDMFTHAFTESGSPSATVALGELLEMVSGHRDYVHDLLTVRGVL